MRHSGLYTSIVASGLIWVKSSEDYLLNFKQMEYIKVVSSAHLIREEFIDNTAEQTPTNNQINSKTTKENSNRKTNLKLPKRKNPKLFPTKKERPVK